MENKYGIDSHKLIYHPERVSRFQKGELIAPIHSEVSLAGGCNHRCKFCSAEYLGHKTAFLDRELFLKNIKVLSENGLKSVYFAGTGEPLLHKDVAEIIEKTKNSGIDVSMSTNGVLLTEDMANKVLPSLSWIRFSFNAIRENTYNVIHRGRVGDLDIVLKNIENAVKIKKQNNLKVTIGIQTILIQDNFDEIFELASKVKELGVDYFTVKSLAKDERIATEVTADFSEEQLIELEECLETLATDDFDVIVRIRTMIKRLKKEKRVFNRCFALPFSFFMDAEGGLWACCAHVEDKSFYYGNIKDGIITDNPEKFFKSTKALSEERDISGCILGCRFEYMNEYLYRIKNPLEHVNFI